MEEIIPFDEINEISFIKKPTSIPIELRPIYKIIEILLIIKYCGGSKKMMNLQKVHFVSWLLKDKSAQELMGTMELAKLINFVHIDPIVNFALDYAIGYGFLRISKTGKIQMNIEGEQLLSDIESHAILQDEIITLQKVNALIKSRG